MANPAIRVQHIGKHYTLGQDAAAGSRFRYKSLTETLSRGRRRKPTADAASFWALQDVSFDVHPGEVVGIIGRNGAGKSTLLKILSRITEPTRGYADVIGRVGSLLEVGTGFHPELSGRENIYLNGAILGMSQAEIRRKFDEIVAFSEVERFLDTPVKHYSSGMYTRLAFAVAAHLDTEILVVDEVLAVGDAEFQKKCLGKMQSVAQREGRTVLFVSHNMAAVRNLCVRGIVLERGQVRFEGGTNQAIAIYSASNQTQQGGTWRREADAPVQPMFFETISVRLLGEQPRLRLECRVKLRCASACAKAFISVDICDTTLSPIMQALPSTQSFIGGEEGVHELLLEIDLPPLVPSIYSADFWVGTHFTATYDYVKHVVSFEVADSPTEGRSFPHTPDHGFMVPPSRCRYETPRR